MNDTTPNVYYGVWIRTGPLLLSAVESDELALHGVTGQRLWKSRQAARQWALRNLSSKQWIVAEETPPEKMKK